MDSSVSKIDKRMYFEGEQFFLLLFQDQFENR